MVIETESSPSRCLIVLGCGYVGRAVVKEALAEGWAVSALTRNPVKAVELRATFGIEVVEADLVEEAWHEALDPSGAWVVNCVSSGGGGVEGYRSSYLGGADSIELWLRRRGPAEGLIYTGSTSVFPQSEGEWVEDADPTAGSTPLNAILVETEERFAAMVRTTGTRSVATVRFSGLYGPGRHHLIDGLKEGAATIPGPGDYFLNLLHRDDAARAVLAVAGAAPDARWEGYLALNATDGAPVTKEAIVQWTVHALGIPEPRFLPDAPNPRMQRRMLANGKVPHRRVRARLLGERFGWRPRYPDFRAGYAEILGLDWTIEDAASS